MILEKPLRKPFVDPVVSEPIDALDATLTFGGLLGQAPFGAGSSGTALDDGDFCNGASYPDSAGQDSADPSEGCPV